MSDDLRAMHERTQRKAEQIAALRMAVAALNQAESESQQSDDRDLCAPAVWDEIHLWAAIPPAANADLRRATMGLQAIVRLLMRSHEVEHTTDADGNARESPLGAHAEAGLHDAAVLLIERISLITDRLQHDATSLVNSYIERSGPGQ